MKNVDPLVARRMWDVVLHQIEWLYMCKLHQINTKLDRFEYYLLVFLEKETTLMLRNNE